MYLSYKEIQNKKLMGRVIARALPHINIRDIRESFGNRGYTYLVNDWLFIKFPLDKFTQKGLEEEVKLLTALRKAAVIKVPEMTLSRVTLPSKLFGCQSKEQAELSFVVYQKVEGATLHMTEFVKLDSDVRLRIVHHLGKFAATLHNLPSEVTGQISLPTETEFFKGIFDYLLPANDTVDNAMLEKAFLKEFFEITDVKRVICHNDLHPGNICVDLKTGWLRGVIDFGSAVMGPRQMEWTPLTYNTEEIKEFNRGYAEVAGEGADVCHSLPQSGLKLNSMNFYGFYKRVQNMYHTR